MKEVKQVTIYLPVRDHKKLKVMAAQNEKTISEIIQQLVKDYLNYEL